MFENANLCTVYWKYSIFGINFGHDEKFIYFLVFFFNWRLITLQYPNINCSSAHTSNHPNQINISFLTAIKLPCLDSKYIKFR